MVALRAAAASRIANERAARLQEGEEEGLSQEAQEWAAAQRADVIPKEGQSSDAMKAAAELAVDGPGEAAARRAPAEDRRRRRS